MKPVRFLGDSLKCLRDFPEDAKQDAGYQLDKVQRGEQPDDFKPMPSIGRGVEEVRVWNDRGTYRVIAYPMLFFACVSKKDAGHGQKRNRFSKGTICRTQGQTAMKKSKTESYDSVWDAIA